MSTQKPRSILAITTAGIAIATAGATTTAGAAVTWEGDVSSSWNNGANWSGGNVPGAGDDVVIPAPTGTHVNPILDVSTTINSLNVQNGGRLNFDQSNAYTMTIDDGKLDVDGGGIVNVDFASSKIILQAADALEINATGQVKLTASGAELEIQAAYSMGHPVDGTLSLEVSGALLDLQANTLFTTSASGRISGSDDAAVIQISADTVFESQISVVGGVLIQGLTGGTDNGKFVNAGEVIAQPNSGGSVIEFHANTIVSDCGTANADLFKVHNGATLKFSRNAQSLSGAFLVEDCGSVLQIASGVGVFTCGSLTFDKGTIQIDGGGATFEYVGFMTNQMCPNPEDTAATGTHCVTDRWVVNTTETCCP